MGLLDAMLGLPLEAAPKPKKKKHHEEERHHRRRRHSSSHVDSRPPILEEVKASPSSSKPDDLESLRRKRTQYLSKPIEEHRRDIDNHRREREAAEAERAPSSSRREKTRDSEVKASRPSHSRRESERKTDKVKGRERDRPRDKDADGYKYVYGPPPPRESRRENEKGKAGIEQAGSLLAAQDISDTHDTPSLRSEPRPNDWGDDRTRDRPSSSTSRHHRSSDHRDRIRDKKEGAGNDWSDKVSVTPSGYVRASRKSSTDASGRKDPPTAARPALERSRTTSRLHADTSRASRTDGRASVASSRDILSKDDITGPRASQASSSVDKVKTKTPGSDVSTPKDRSSTTRPVQTRRTSTLRRIREDPGPKKVTEEPKRARSSSLPAPRTISCSICTDDFANSQIEELPCSHAWCHGCLKRTFYFTPEGAVIGTQPTCCNRPLQKDIAKRVLTPDERKKWDRKITELADKKPIYCPTKTCDSRWISKEHYVAGRYALCSKCKSKVCLKCKDLYHGDRKCPRNTGDKEMAQLAKDEGYQRCKKCKIFVERTEGCSHMSCKCGNHFCYVCGENYITSLRPSCRCPIYDQDPDQDDFLDEQFARRQQRDFVDLRMNDWLGRDRAPRWDEFDDDFIAPDHRRQREELDRFEPPRRRERGPARHDDGRLGDRIRVGGYEQNLFVGRDREREHGRRHEDLWEDEFEYGGRDDFDDWLD